MQATKQDYRKTHSIRDYKEKLQIIRKNASYQVGLQEDAFDKGLDSGAILELTCIECQLESDESIKCKD
jgi:hypothetical protein